MKFTEQESDAVYASLRRERNIGFVFGCFGLVVTLISITTLRAMLPLKELQPWLIRENTCTGEISVPERITAENYQSTKPTDLKYTYEYFRARERYAPRMMDDDIKTVYLLSSEAQAKAYEDFMDNHPDSPVKPLKGVGEREVYVKSLVPLNADQIQIRFTTTDTISGMKQPAQHWIAIVTFAYSATNVPNDQQNVYKNPMGFMVTDYQREPELLQEKR